MTRMAIELIQRLDKRSEKQIYRELLADVARVEGKMQILSRVAKRLSNNPMAIREVIIFPQVKEETFSDWAPNSGPVARTCGCSDRRYGAQVRAPLSADAAGVAEDVQFRSDNRFQPLIEALRPFVAPHTIGHFPEDVPVEGIVTRSWHEKVFEEVKARRRSIGTTTNCASSRSCSAP